MKLFTLQNKKERKSRNQVVIEDYYFFYCSTPNQSNICKKNSNPHFVCKDEPHDRLNISSFDPPLFEFFLILQTINDPTFSLLNFLCSTFC